MRPEGNPLDLNNLPEDFPRDGKQTSGDSSSSAGGYRKKKSGGAKEGKDEAGKVYECRFCSLKFCKSQALGGHMNRHRQERETETLNKARELVFTNDLAPSHLGYVSSQPIQQGGYHHQASNSISMYPTRVFSSSPLVPSAPAPPPPAAPFMYPSPPQLLSFPSQYATAPPANDYFVGHVLNNEGNYTCIGAPVGHRFGNNGSGGGGGGSGGDWGRR